MIRTFLFTCLLCALLTACTSPTAAAPPPTPQALMVSRPPALQGWDERIVACAKQFPQLGVFIVEGLSEPIPEDALSIQLHWGTVGAAASNAFLLSTDDLLLAANRAFPLVELTQKQLQAIYTAQLTSAAALDPAGADAALQPWTYPEGDETRLIFEQVLLGELAAPLLAQLVPDPKAMLEALSENPGAIGYLPRSAFLNVSEAQKGQIKMLTVAGETAGERTQPVIAQLAAQPGEELNAFLQCLH